MSKNYLSKLLLSVAIAIHLLAAVKTFAQTSTIYEKGIATAKQDYDQLSGLLRTAREPVFKEKEINRLQKILTETEWVLENQVIIKELVDSIQNALPTLEEIDAQNLAFKKEFTQKISTYDTCREQTEGCQIEFTLGKVIDYFAKINSIYKKSTNITDSFLQALHSKAATEFSINLEEGLKALEIWNSYVKQRNLKLPYLNWNESSHSLEVNWAKDEKLIVTVNQSDFTSLCASNQDKKIIIEQPMPNRALNKKNTSTDAQAWEWIDRCEIKYRGHFLSAKKRTNIQNSRLFRQSNRPALYESLLNPKTGYTAIESLDKIRKRVEQGELTTEHDLLAYVSQAYQIISYNYQAADDFWALVKNGLTGQYEIIWIDLIVPYQPKNYFDNTRYICPSMPSEKYIFCIYAEGKAINIDSKTGNDTTPYVVAYRKNNDIRFQGLKKTTLTEDQKSKYLNFINGSKWVPDQTLE